MRAGLEAEVGGLGDSSLLFWLCGSVVSARLLRERGSSSALFFVVLCDDVLLFCVMMLCARCARKFEFGGRGYIGSLDTLPR